MRVCAARTTALAAALGLTACEGVPTLTFAQGDADMADAEAGNEVVAPSEVEASCPESAPQNATCCGDVPCYGSFCNTANCAACSACKAPDVCCSKTTQNAVCSPVCH
jgi:hypothetical protein